RALQVVPPIAYDTPDSPPFHHRVNHPVNGPGGAGAPVRSWNAAAPPSSTTPSSVPPPGGGSGTVASPAPRIGGAPPGHRAYRGPSDTQPAAPPDTHPDTAAGDNTAGDTTAGDNTAADEQPADDPDGRTIDGLGPRATELLLFLAVHPGGAGRDYLVATLWPD